MADLGRDFVFLVASVRRSIAQLKAAADPRRVGSERGKVLQAHITQTLDAIEDRVVRSEARFSAAVSDVERSSLIDSLRNLNRYVSGMHEATPWMESAMDPDLHIGLLYFVDEAAMALISADAEIVPTGDAKYQYATVSWPFRPILQRLLRSPAVGPRPVIIFYPPQERPSLLLHSLFAHELAHPAIDEHKLVDAVLHRHLADAGFAQAFDAAVADFANRAPAPLPAARLTLRKRLNAWTTELLCDALATEYIGPSFLLAFGAVVLAMSWNEPQERHPPTTLRVELMLEQLRITGWDTPLRTRIPSTLGWFEDVASAGTGAGTTYEQFLESSARRVADDVRQQATARLGPNRYEPGMFTPLEPDVTEFLRRRILPAQRPNGQPEDRRAVLLAGWLYLFESDGDEPTTIPVGAANDEYQEFLATALEMSRLVEGWRST